MHWLPSSPYPGSPTLPPRTPRSNCMFTDEGHVGMKRVCVWGGCHCSSIVSNLKTAQLWPRKKLAQVKNIPAASMETAEPINGQEWGSLSKLYGKNPKVGDDRLPGIDPIHITKGSCKLVTIFWLTSFAVTNNCSLANWWHWPSVTHSVPVHRS